MNFLESGLTVGIVCTLLAAALYIGYDYGVEETKRRIVQTCPDSQRGERLATMTNHGSHLICTYTHVGYGRATRTEVVK